MSNKRSLITGVAGFSAAYLAVELARDDRDVFGIDLVQPDDRALSSVIPAHHIRQVDLLDQTALRRHLREISPDEVYHLAAVVHPSHDMGDQVLYRVNVQGTINLLEALRIECPSCRVLITGSSAQYGLVHLDENPISESQLFRPVSHYGISKVAQELVGYRYWSAHGLAVVQTRTFNIVGPRQGVNLVASAFARQVVEIEQGWKEPMIDVGNLDSRRDFVDVRDAVRAYSLALQLGRPGQAYNVCSGQPIRIQSLLDQLILASRRRGIAVRRAPSRLQAADVPLQVGDHRKLSRETGWQPRISWDQTIGDLLDYWRSTLSEA